MQANFNNNGQNTGNSTNALNNSSHGNSLQRAGSLNKNSEVSGSNLPQEEYKEGDEFELKFEKPSSNVVASMSSPDKVRSNEDVLFDKIE